MASVKILSNGNPGDLDLSQILEGLEKASSDIAFKTSVNGFFRSSAIGSRTESELNCEPNFELRIHIRSNESRPVESKIRKIWFRADASDSRSQKFEGSTDPPAKTVTISVYEKIGLCKFAIILLIPLPNKNEGFRS